MLLVCVCVFNLYMCCISRHHIKLDSRQLLCLYAAAVPHGERLNDVRTSTWMEDDERWIDDDDDDDGDQI